MDKKSQVNAGAEGSGAAQIFNPTKALQAYGNVAMAKAEVAKYQMQRDIAAMDKLKSSITEFEAPWTKDIDEVHNDISKLMDAMTQAQIRGEDPTDPTSQISKDVVKAKMAIEAKVRMSQNHEKAYNEALTYIGNPEYDQEHLYTTLEKFKQAKTLTERDQYSQNFTVPHYDYITPVEEIPLVMDQEVDERGMVTTTTKKPREQALDMNIALWQNSAAGQQHYQNGKKKGMWASPQEHVTAVKEMRLSMPDAGLVNKRSEDEPRKPVTGNGIEVNFGGVAAGGGGNVRHGGWQFSFIPKDKELGVNMLPNGNYNPNVKVVEIGVAYKDKNATPIQMNHTDPTTGEDEVITAIPIRMFASKREDGSVHINKVIVKKLVDKGMTAGSSGTVDVEYDFATLPELVLSYDDNEAILKSVIIDPKTNTSFDPLQAATDFFNAQSAVPAKKEEPKPAEKKESKPASKLAEKKVLSEEELKKMTPEQRKEYYLKNKAR
jgi:hypothetical protein